MQKLVTGLLSRRYLVYLILFLIVSVGVFAGLTSLSKSPTNQTDNNQAEENQMAIEPILSFTAAGDFGNNSDTDKVFEQAAILEPDFMLALGDFSYDQGKGEEAWCALVHKKFGNTFPFMLIAGNHDIDGADNGVADHLERYTKCLPNRMPNMVGDYAQQYYFDFGKTMRVIAISPDLNIFGHKYDYSKQGAGYKWVSQTIDEAKEQQIDWVVLAMHKNCITTGVKQCDIGEDVFNLAVEKGVDLMLQGHEHGYMRSYQFRHSDKCPSIRAETFNQQCILQPEHGKYHKGNGPILVINGTGGFVLREINTKRPENKYFADWHGLKTDPTHGPSYFRIYIDRVEVDFVGPDGSIKDSFTISKK